jgi:hypothetical protein
MTTESRTTTVPEGSRVLFSTYDAGDDYSWSVRWKRPGARPVTLCRSQKDTARVTKDIMEELFKDQRVEAILADLLRRHGEA